jgi:hypothetical protein
MASDYLPFASVAGANVLAQADYVDLLDRPRGFQSGQAVSANFNKVWRQASVMTAAIAQFIDGRVSTDVLDDGNVANLAAQLAAAIGAVAATGGIPEAPGTGQFLRGSSAWQDSANLSLEGGSW